MLPPCMKRIPYLGYFKKAQISTSGTRVPRSVQTFATPWTVAHQAPPSMGFSRQEYWNGVPLPSPVIYIAIKFKSESRLPGEISITSTGNPLQYSCLENPMDGGAWWATVHGVAKSWTRLSDFTFFLSQETTNSKNFWADFHDIN